MLALWSHWDSPIKSRIVNMTHFPVSSGAHVVIHHSVRTAKVAANMHPTTCSGTVPYLHVHCNTILCSFSQTLLCQIRLFEGGLWTDICAQIKCGETKAGRSHRADISQRNLIILKTVAILKSSLNVTLALARNTAYTDTPANLHQIDLKIIFLQNLIKQLTNDKYLML